jgi:F0F1-type ATP synthase epsilon subunit
MSADTFQLKVITPEGVALDERVLSATVPTSEGEIGVLTLHTRYCGLVGNGKLSYAKVGGANESLVVHEGFCHFIDDSLTILADSVEK